MTGKAAAQYPPPPPPAPRSQVPIADRHTPPLRSHSCCTVATGGTSSAQPALVSQGRVHCDVLQALLAVVDHRGRDQGLALAVPALAPRVGGEILQGGARVPQGTQEDGGDDVAAREGLVGTAVD